MRLSLVTSGRILELEAQYRYYNNSISIICTGEKAWKPVKPDQYKNSY